MNYSNILIWAPLLAVLVAIITLLVQMRRSKFSLNVDLLLKLNDHFNSDRFKTLRRAAAKSIKTHTFGEAEEVVDFFEMIGLLVRRRALDPELVRHSFFYWIHSYRCALDHHITIVRQKDPTVWENFVFLHKKVTSVEKRKRKCLDSAIKLTETDLQEFVRDESTLM